MLLFGEMLGTGEQKCNYYASTDEHNFHSNTATKNCTKFKMKLAEANIHYQVKEQQSVQSSILNMMEAKTLQNELKLKDIEMV